MVLSIIGAGRPLSNHHGNFEDQNLLLTGYGRYTAYPGTPASEVTGREKEHGPWVCSCQDPRVDVQS